MSRKYVRVAVSVTLVLAGVCVGVVRNYNSRNNRNSVETEERFVFVEDTEKGIERESGSYREVESLFGKEVDKEDRDNFLGDADELYTDNLFSSIESIASTLIDNLPDINNYDGNDKTSIGIFNSDTLGLRSGSFFDLNNFFIVDSLTVIDIFNDNYAVLAYNYPDNIDKELVVVDFSKTKVNSDIRDTVFDYGDVLSVKGTVENTAYREVDGFCVLFLKAD